MKLQISFDTTDLESTINVARSVSKHADILEIGTILLYTHGKKIAQQFRAAFPDKKILVDAKIVDRGKLIIDEFAPIGIDWITVMAGTKKSVIHSACLRARDHGIKVMLDLLDSPSLSQSALEAKNLGVDALVFHQPHDEEESFLFLENWNLIRDNTSLPIFVSGKIKRETIDSILQIKPDGIIVGNSITDAENPAQEAHFFRELISPTKQ